MRKKLHGVVLVLVVSLLVGGLALPAVAQMDQERQSEQSQMGAGGEKTSSYQSSIRYETDDEEFESWYGESDKWIK
ncbi:MAG: hypothetical protein GX591_11670 [Planctomycetes bacterium]|nr:hypothetical protein [Planctomycetota bacterium]